MPRKRDSGPAPDYAEFASRLTKILKNLNVKRSEFARRANLVQNTFNTYFHGKEPDRPTIVKIARAAGVSAGYIVDGADAAAQQPPTEAPDVDLTCFRNNLRYYLATGPERRAALVRESGLSLERLTQLSRGRVPSIADVLGMGNYLNLKRLFNDEYFSAEFLDLPGRIRTQSSIMPNPEEDPHVIVSPNDFEIFKKVNSEMIKRLGVGGLEHVLQPDETMAPSLKMNDQAIAIKRPEILRSGLYMFRNKKNRTFVMRANIMTDDTVELNYDNPSHQSFGKLPFDPSKLTCVGPVVFRILGSDK